MHPVKCSYCPNIVARRHPTAPATCFPCKVLAKKAYYLSHKKRK